MVHFDLEILILLHYSIHFLRILIIISSFSWWGHESWISADLISADFCFIWSALRLEFPVSSCGPSSSRGSRHRMCPSWCGCRWSWCWIHICLDCSAIETVAVIYSTHTSFLLHVCLPPPTTAVGATPQGLTAGHDHASSLPISFCTPFPWFHHSSLSFLSSFTGPTLYI